MSKATLWNRFLERNPPLQKAADFLRSWISYIPGLSWRNSSKLIALEITSSDIKLIGMTKHLLHYRIEYYAVASLPKDATSENEIRQPENVTAALKRTLQRTEQSAHYAITVLPSSMTISKKVLMEETRDPEVLDSLIEEVAGKNIPYPLAELSLDYVPLGSSREEIGKMEMLLIAAQTRHVAERINVIENAGLEVKILDVDCYAMCRSLALLAHQIPKEIFSKGMIAIVDIGSKNTKLNVVSNQELIFTHEELFGGASLTEAVEKTYGLSHEQAELAKQTDTLPSDYQTQFAEPFKKTATQQTIRLLQFFYSSTNFDHVDFLVVAGGVALMPGLVEMISAAAKIPTVVADPCANLQVSAEVNRELLVANSPALMVVLGLAMRGANL